MKNNEKEKKKTKEKKGERKVEDDRREEQGKIHPPKTKRYNLSLESYYTAWVSEDEENIHHYSHDFGGAGCLSTIK